MLWKRNEMNEKKKYKKLQQLNEIHNEEHNCESARERDKDIMR